MRSTVFEEALFNLPVPKFYCPKEIKRNEATNSVYCGRLDQWVSVRLCVQCSEKKVIPAI